MYLIFVTSFFTHAVGIVNLFYLHRAGCHKEQVLRTSVIVFNICNFLSSSVIILKWLFPQTVIFAADVRISFDKFRNSMTATVISKTIITTNPGKKLSETFNPFGNDYIMYSNICTVYLRMKMKLGFHLS